MSSLDRESIARSPPVRSVSTAPAVSTSDEPSWTEPDLPMPATADNLRDLHLLHQRAKALRDRLTSGPKTARRPRGRR